METNNKSQEDIKPTATPEVETPVAETPTTAPVTEETPVVEETPAVEETPVVDAAESSATKTTSADANAVPTKRQRIIKWLTGPGGEAVAVVGTVAIAAVVVKVAVRMLAKSIGELADDAELEAINEAQDSLTEGEDDNVLG